MRKLKRFFTSTAFLHLLMIPIALSVLATVMVNMKNANKEKKDYADHLDQIEVSPAPMFDMPSGNAAVSGDSVDNGAKAVGNDSSENTSDNTRDSLNIEKASDYVNFEKLIMQISEYTEPDEQQPNESNAGSVSGDVENVEETTEEMILESK